MILRCKVIEVLDDPDNLFWDPPPFLSEKFEDLSRRFADKSILFESVDPEKKK